MAKTVQDAQAKAASAKARTRSSTKGTAKAAAKASPKPKAKPKASVASQPQTMPSASSKKRAHTDANPFDQPPDVGQSSILKFAKTANQENAAETDTATATTTEASVSMDIERTADHDDNDKDIITSTVPSDDGDFQPSHVPSTLPPTGGKTHTIDQMVETAFNHWKSQPSNWMSVLTDMCKALDEDTISLLIGQCRDHPLFTDHCASVRESSQLADDEWTFGDQDTGDPLEDLAEMIRWLALRRATGHQIDKNETNIGEARLLDCWVQKKKKTTINESMIQLCSVVCQCQWFCFVFHIDGSISPMI